MAQMHPGSPLKGSLSSGERKVFFALQDNLPQAFTVLHSVALLTRPREAHRLLDGEIDFIICHPAYGLIVVEAKGGGICCDAQSQRWTSISADGVEHDIKNPYEQARRNLYALQEELHASKLAKRFDFPCGFAVWYPDVELDARSLGLSTAYRQITLDATALASPELEIRRIFRECLLRTTSQPPSDVGISEMVRHLMPSWRIPVRLRTALHEEEEVLVEATRSQYKVLSLLGRTKRALICGSAGSGKTSLAMEKARWLSEEGRDVLLVCFNTRIAEWLRRATSKWRGIDAFHYHGLCMHLCALAKMPKPQPDPYGDREAFFRYELSDAMLQALEIVSQRYDAILVDEAQDFDPVWWIGIEQLLRDPAESLLYLFYDDNQQIYARRPEFPLKEEPLILCENCRNTVTIFDAFMQFYRGNATPEAVGPTGRSIEIVSHVSEVDELPALMRVLRRLLEEERIPPVNITILTPRVEAKSIWKEGARVGTNSLITWNANPSLNSVACATIHTFKGLENSVIVITEIAHVHHEKLRELFYVAYSRAKFHLIVSRLAPAPSLLA
jgi:Nuclease-related domain/AAA domain/UvrD-like helicase C-terminal domain